jgi:hypothetical protein
MILQEMMVGIRDRMSDFERSDDEEDGEDGDNEHPELPQLTEHYKSGWEMSTITKAIQ